MFSCFIISHGTSSLLTGHLFQVSFQQKSEGAANLRSSQSSLRVYRHKNIALFDMMTHDVYLQVYMKP